MMIFWLGSQVKTGLVTFLFEISQQNSVEHPVLMIFVRLVGRWNTGKYLLQERIGFDLYVQIAGLLVGKGKHIFPKSCIYTFNHLTLNRK